MSLMRQKRSLLANKFLEKNQQLKTGQVGSALQKNVWISDCHEWKFLVWRSVC